MPKFWCRIYWFWLIGVMVHILWDILLILPSSLLLSLSFVRDSKFVSVIVCMYIWKKWYANYSPVYRGDRFFLIVANAATPNGAHYKQKYHKRLLYVLKYLENPLEEEKHRIGGWFTAMRCCLLYPRIVCVHFCFAG